MDQFVDRLDAPFLSAAGVSLALIRRPEVADGWDRPSVLAEMSVGALACHLGRQTVRAAELLPRTTDVVPLDSADAHYHSAAWVTSTSPDDPSNDRSEDDREAALGPAALERRASEAVTSTQQILSRGEARDVVLIPWQGWSLRRDDFLLTRLVEIAVHSDDLALSVQAPPPVLPAEALEPVLELLTRLAVRRHGQSAVISTLTRSERSGPISAF